jgi:hypothetical protein
VFQTIFFVGKMWTIEKLSQTGSYFVSPVAKAIAYSLEWERLIAISFSPSLFASVWAPP